MKFFLSLSYSHTHTHTHTHILSPTFFVDSKRRQFPDTKQFDFENIIAFYLKPQGGDDVCVCIRVRVCERERKVEEGNADIPPLPCIF